MFVMETDEAEIMREVSAVTAAPEIVNSPRAVVLPAFASIVIFPVPALSVRFPVPDAGPLKF